MAKTATAPKSAADIVSDFASQREQLLQAAEEICTSYHEQVDRNRIGTNAILSIFTRDERHVFAALGWDNNEVSAELSRCRAVQRLQRAAGTKEERKAAHALHADLTKQLKTRGREIAAEIQKLQSELTALENAHRAAEIDVDARERAALALREKVPAHVRDDHAELKRDLHMEFSHLPELQSRASFIQSTLAMEDREQVITAMRHNDEFPRDILRFDNHKCVGVDLDALNRFKTVLRLELEGDGTGPGLAEQIADLKAAKAERRAEIDKTLDIYSR